LRIFEGDLFDESGFAGDSHSTRPARLVQQLQDLLKSNVEPEELFHEFTRVLQRGFPIRKGLMALRDRAQTRFLAVASWRSGIRKKLSLCLPTASSLFERVAEDGRAYCDSFALSFDGNQIERRLLLDDETQSFVLRPIKHQGRVVALLGYSSDRVDAFAALEESIFEPVMEKFGEMIGKHLARTASAPSAI